MMKSGKYVAKTDVFTTPKMEKGKLFWIANLGEVLVGIVQHQSGLQKLVGQSQIVNKWAQFRIQEQITLAWNT